MDVETLKTLLAVINGGGPVVTVVALWVAWRAGMTANKAVQALLEIRDSVKVSAPAVQEMLPLVKEIAKATDDTNERTRDMQAAMRTKPA